VTIDVLQLMLALIVN